MTPFLNAADLAGILGVCRETVRRMARDGRIPSVRVGKSVRFDLDAVRQHLGAK